MNKCKNCNKNLDKRHKVYCSRLCQNRYQSKYKNSFKGKQHSIETKSKISKANLGRIFRNENTKTNDGHGYIFIYKPNHPASNKMGYVREHRYVMEQHIGRLLLKTEIVHHIDNNGTNNHINNLMLFKSTKEHLRFHWMIGEFIVTKYGYDIIKEYSEWLEKQPISSKKRIYVREN